MFFYARIVDWNMNDFGCLIFFERKFFRVNKSFKIKMISFGLSDVVRPSFEANRGSDTLRLSHGSISADFNPLGFSKSHLASEGRTRVSERVTRGVRAEKRGGPSANPRGILERIREALGSKNPRGDRI